MKTFLKNITLFLLTAFSRIAIKIHKPTIVAITGSVGKTTTKDMIVSILKEGGLSAKGSPKSYNSEFGVPLSIFNLSSGVSNPIKWLQILLISFFKIFIGIPKYIILEVGLENPGDISKIVKWLKPDISLITLLAKNPVHLERFDSRESLYKEKLELFQATKKDGVIVFNKEDKVQREYIEKLEKKTKIHEFNSESLFIENTSIHYDKNNPVGTDILINMDGKKETFYIPDIIGEGAAKSLIASLAVVRAISKDVGVEVIRKAIASRKATVGRMHILEGKKGSVIIDDSYNASPVAMEKAIQALSIIDKKKKIAVLGIMAEVGSERDEIHSTLGDLISKSVDKAFILGDISYGDKDNIFYAKNHSEIVDKCIKEADKDTVFLFKGSQVSRIEKIVKELISDKVDSKKSLVRQEDFWIK